MSTHHRQLQARSPLPFPNLGGPCCPWCTYPCTPMDCANHRRIPATSSLLTARPTTTQGAST